MKGFMYSAPKTVKKAVSLLAELKGDGKIICGGQSMLVLMKQNMVTVGTRRGHQGDCGTGLHQTQ